MSESDQPAPAGSPLAGGPQFRLPAGYDPGLMSPAGWIYPETFGDRFSRWSRRLIRGLLAIFGLLSLVLLVLWGVPALVVARSDEYRLACQRAEEDRGGYMASYVGHPLHCEAIPSYYRLGQRSDFQFLVSGSRGSARVAAAVEGGRVIEFRIESLRGF